MNENQAVKLLLVYDIIPETANEYLEFALGEMIPRLQVLGVHTLEAWHTAFGERPIRLIVMAARDRETLDRALSTPDWQDLEARLQQYVVNYHRRAVPARSQFQFFNAPSTEWY
jgi:hypothetical protein